MCGPAGRNCGGVIGRGRHPRRLHPVAVRGRRRDQLGPAPRLLPGDLLARRTWHHDRLHVAVRTTVRPVGPRPARADGGLPLPPGGRARRRPAEDVALRRRPHHPSVLRCHRVVAVDQGDDGLHRVERQRHLPRSPARAARADGGVPLPVLDLAGRRRQATRADRSHVDVRGRVHGSDLRAGDPLARRDRSHDGLRGVQRQPYVPRDAGRAPRADGRLHVPLRLRAEDVDARARSPRSRPGRRSGLRQRKVRRLRLESAGPRGGRHQSGARRLRPRSQERPDRSRLGLEQRSAGQPRLGHLRAPRHLQRRSVRHLRLGGDELGAR